MISELPTQILAPSLLSVGVYWITGLNDDSFAKFLIFRKVHLVLFIVLCHIVGAGIGYIAGILFSDSTSAVGATPLLIGLFLMVGGFFVSSNSLNNYVSWLRYLSPFYFGFQGVAVNEYKDLELDCGCPAEMPDCSCDALEILGFDGVDLWEPIVGLFYLLVAVRIIAVSLLIVKSKRMG